MSGSATGEVTEREPRGAADIQPDAIVAIPVRHYGQWVAAGLVLLLLAMLVAAVASNKVFDFALVPAYLLKPAVLLGVLRTVEMTVLTMGIGISLGLIAAVFRLSSAPVLKWVSWAYIWFFRGTPVLVQLIFWFNLGVVFPTLGIGIPFTSIMLWSQPTSSLISPFAAALLGLGLNEGAYMSEIIRSGIISLDIGQTEAALAVGMRRRQIMRHIVLPQAMRVIIPPTGNEVIGMLKLTALASVISYNELLGTVQNIYSTNLKTLELLVVASIWYIALTTVLTIGQLFLERRFSRSTGRSVEGGVLMRLQRQLTHIRSQA